MRTQQCPLIFTCNGIQVFPSLFSPAFRLFGVRWREFRKQLRRSPRAGDLRCSDCPVPGGRVFALPPVAVRLGFGSGSQVPAQLFDHRVTHTPLLMLASCHSIFHTHHTRLDPWSEESAERHAQPVIDTFTKKRIIKGQCLNTVKSP